MFIPHFRNGNLPEGVRTDEPPVVLFKSFLTVKQELEKSKEDFLNKPVERDKRTEEAVWNRQINPIIEKHHIKRIDGTDFKYSFIEKEINERDIDNMYRATIFFCSNLNPPWGEDENGNVDWVFIKYIIKLRDYPPEKVDFNLVEKFHAFLIACYKDDTIPELLEFIRRKTGFDTETATEGDHEQFIRELRVYYENDEEIKIQIPGRKPICGRYDQMRFSRKDTAEWKTLLKILNEPPHTYSVGPSGTSSAGIRTPHKEYHAKQKRLKSIDKKMKAFFEMEFKISLPNDYKIYEKCPAEKSGTYRFKFSVASDKADKTGNPSFSQKFAQLPDKELKLKFQQESQSYLKTPDRFERIDELVELTNAVIKRKIFTQEEADAALKRNREKETHIYNKYENEEAPE